MSTTKKKRDRDIVLGSVSATPEEFSLKDAKIRITMMVDLDVVEEYRALAKKMGSKYQTLMNQKLREALQTEKEKMDLAERVKKLELHVYGNKAG
jgi:uncharacterized protein (DUF4415 family)